MQRPKTFSRYLSQIDDTRAHFALERLSRFSRASLREEYVPRINHKALFAAEKALSPFLSSAEGLFNSESSKPLEPGDLLVNSVAPAVAGEITRIEFDSSYSSQLRPEAIQTSVIANVWRHAPGTARGRIYLLCEETESSHLSVLRYAPQYWFALGFDLVMLEVPGSFRSEACLEDGSIDLLKTHDFLAKSIHCLRELRTFLQRDNDLAEGVLSYGFASYVMSLWASLDVFDFAVASQPIVSLESYLLDSLFGSAPEDSVSALAQVKERMFPAAVQESLSTVLSCAGPLRMDSKVASEACLVFGAESAQDLSARQLVRLAEHQQSSPLIIPGSPFTQFYRPEFRAIVRDVLLDTILAAGAEERAAA